MDNGHGRSKASPLAAGVLLLLGAVLTGWTATATDAPEQCAVCLVSVGGAVAANGWASGALAVALAVLGFGMVSGKRVAPMVWTVLGLGVLAVVVSLLMHASGPFVQLGERASTIAATGVGLVFLYLAVAVLLLARLVPSSVGGGRTVVSVPPGDESHHIMAIEGLGPKYTTRLNAHGIITIPQLLAADPMTIGKVADATHQLAEQWQAEGALIQVKGIGPQFAEMLALAGIRSVQQLADSDVDDLLSTIDDIEKRRKVRVLKTDVKRHHVEKLVQAARQHVAAA